MTRLRSAHLFCLLLYLRITVNCEDTTTTTVIAPTTTDTPSSSNELTTTTPPSTPTITPPSTPTMTPPSTPTITSLSTQTTETSISSDSPITSEETTLTDSTEFTPTSTTQTTPTTPPPLSIKGQRSFTWGDSSDDIAVIFEVDLGYFISVTVSDVNISNGNYLSIEGGTSHINGATDGRVFANTVKGPISYLFKATSVFGFCKNTRPDGDNKGFAKFTVKFERVGEGTSTVTTTSSTTTVSVPPTQKDDSVYITVNVTGRNYLEYNNTDLRQTFKQCVVDVAINYCEMNNIVLLADITIAYVLIAEIKQCPYNWPDSSTCVQITFRLPIFSNLDGYQLNTQHLKSMWSRKDQLDNSSCFNNNSFKDYDEPNFELAITWWAIAISLVIIAFVVLLWFFRIFSSRMKTALKKRQNRNRRNSDTVSIMSSKKGSVGSLSPHYLQDHLGTSTPKIFEI